MPILEVHTNMTDDAFSADFHEKLAKVAASIFKRPQNVMIVGLSTDAKLYLGSGVSDPVFLLRVFNADAFEDAEENREIIKGLTDFLTGEMAIPENSIRILLFNAPSTQVGLQGGRLLADVIEERQNAKGALQPPQE